MNQAEQILDRIRPEMEVLRRRYRVRRLGLFGSWVRGEASATSDVDLLVDLEPFGLDNPNEVFVAMNEPYGLIEATIRR